MNAIELRNVYKDFGEFSLKNINLNIPCGYIVGLVGENGSGKSSLIKTILNLVKADKGEVNILGENDLENNREVLGKTGVFLDDFYLPVEFTIIQIENIMKDIYSNWESDRFFDLIERFDLPLDKKIGEFSKGMKVKATLAITLSHNASLLILDEPTSGLDSVIRNELLEIFLDFMQEPNNSILLSSHISSDLEKIADYIAYIEDGEILFVESKDTIIYEYGIIRCKKSQLGEIDLKDIIACKENSMGYDIIISNKNYARKKYENLTIDDVNIDELILTMKRERLEK
ncbi:MAG: ABC transporter ATP-binding protein [Tissierellia bacterium]|nr:ABC transporter ATP-binding protein [Tissierellia bacterium]